MIHLVKVVLHRKVIDVYPGGRCSRMVGNHSGRQITQYSPHYDDEDSADDGDDDDHDDDNDDEEENEDCN